MYLLTILQFNIEYVIRPIKIVLASSGWVHLQKLILPLFENVCEESTDPTIIRLAQEFTLDPSSGVYLVNMFIPSTSTSDTRPNA